MASGRALIGFWEPVRGGSMEPALRSGDEVLLVPAHGTARPGEVVAVRLAAGTLALHRVAEVRAGTVETRGDACARTDRRIPRGSVLFRAVMRRREGRVEPIPRPGPGAWLARSRWTRPLARLIAAPGRSWRARPS